MVDGVLERLCGERCWNLAVETLRLGDWPSYWRIHLVCDMHSKHSKHGKYGKRHDILADGEALRTWLLEHGMEPPSAAWIDTQREEDEDDSEGDAEGERERERKRERAEAIKSPEQWAQFVNRVRIRSAALFYTPQLMRDAMKRDPSIELFWRARQWEEKIAAQEQKLVEMNRAHRPQSEVDVVEDYSGSSSGSESEGSQTARARTRQPLRWILPRRSRKRARLAEKEKETETGTKTEKTDKGDEGGNTTL
jgi:hypothetical protein